MCQEIHRLYTCGHYYNKISACAKGCAKPTHTNGAPMGYNCNGCKAAGKK
jgi:hypothetical protein